MNTLFYSTIFSMTFEIDQNTTRHITFFFLLRAHKHEYTDIICCLVAYDIQLQNPLK